jgi:Gametolysin peptidase M11
VGGPRYVALALLAPLFGMPAAAAAAGPTPSLHGQHSSALAGRSAASAGRDTRSGRFSGRLAAPASVRLLAARLYWGHRPPSYPSVRTVSSDLGKTADWYARVSRGRERLHVTVTRWVHVKASADRMCNTERGSIRAASAALRRAGYHPDRFNRLMIFTEQCNAAASAAQLPGRVSWVRFRSPGMATLVHELGHNLGLEHAYGLVCRGNGRRVALGGSCSAVEYGDSWDAMGHSKGFFSAPALVRLGWAGRIRDIRGSGTFQVADVEHSGSANQALRIRAGRTTYWVEYQPEHSPQVGRTIPGVMIRRQVGRGPVEMIDASPGNPTGIAYPDADLTNSALPVGSSLTTPERIRITTISTGRRATVQVAFDQPAAVPDAPVVEAAAQVDDRYQVRWSAPADNGQIVLGYRVTASPSGVTRLVTGPAGYRTTVSFPLGNDGPETFTVQALNQDGWSAPSEAVTGTVYGPDVTVTSPPVGAKLSRAFTVSVRAAADEQTHSTPTSAWAEVGSVNCTTQDGSGPYTLRCAGAPHGRQTLTVHVRNANGITTDVPVAVRVHGH